jgi:hypothetical protein
MKQKFNFNFSFLERFKKTKSIENANEESFDHPSSEYSDSNSSEYDSSESPEEFAEKTLGGINLNKIQEQSVDSEEQVTHFTNEEVHSEDDESEDSDFDFKEMELPGKPEVIKKPRFKFPTFNRFNAQSRIKSTFAGKLPINGFNKFTWNDFVLRLFSPYSRGRIHSFFIILLVVSITYMLGKNLALLFNKNPPIIKNVRSNQFPIERVNTSLQDINKIASTNLFNIKETDKSNITIVKKDIESIVCTDADRPTALQIKLLDTIVLQDSVKSVASVQVRGSAELMNVREGEKLDEMAEVSKIDRMKLILKNLQTGDCEYATTEAEGLFLLNDWILHLCGISFDRLAINSLRKSLFDLILLV